jgi:hypothetical protein
MNQRNYHRKNVCFFLRMKIKIYKRLSIMQCNSNAIYHHMVLYHMYFITGQNEIYDVKCNTRFGNFLSKTFYVKQIWNLKENGASAFTYWVNSSHVLNWEGFCFHWHTKERKDRYCCKTKISDEKNKIVGLKKKRQIVFFFVVVDR